MQQNVPKLWIFVFFAVMALVLAILVTGPPAPETQTEESVATDPVRTQTFESMLEKGSNAIYVENQQSGQGYVQVGYVVMSGSGFVVIYDNNEGVPGQVVGTSDYLETGGEHLVVPLDEPLENDQVYYAMLYEDDGDGRFREGEDTQVVDSENNVILMTFLANEASQPETGPVNP